MAPGCALIFHRRKHHNQRIVHDTNEIYPAGSSKNGLQILPVGTYWFRVGKHTINPPRVRLGNRPDNFVELLPGFKLKWGQAHVNKYVGVHIILQETPQVRFTLEGIQHQAEYRLLDVSKIIFDPKIALLRLRFTPHSRLIKPRSLWIPVVHFRLAYQRVKRLRWASTRPKTITVFSM